MRRAYSYIRFSRPEQMRGDSLRRQMEASAAYCERHGLVLDESLSLRDLGVSAFRGAHAATGALSSFLSAVEDGNIPKGSVLIVESLDRLSRQELGKAQALILSILNAGVSIVTLSPEREYAAASANDIGAAIEIMTILFRAHEESAVKSQRLNASWSNKRKQAVTKKMTARGPSWLKLSDDRERWELIPERVEVVKRIYQWAANGKGAHLILKRLNAEGVPTFLHGVNWHRSTIQKILTSRTVLGEMQPTKHMPNGKREPIGEPVKDYYPRIISDSLFFKARAAAQGRKTLKVRGRQGKNVTSLFSGLVFNAQDGSTFVVRWKRWTRRDGQRIRERRMVSHKGVSGDADAVPMSYDYEAFERATLAWLREIRPQSILSAEGQNGAADNADALEAIETKLADVTERIEKVQARMMGAGSFEALIDLLAKLDSERQALKAEADTVKAQRHADSGEAIFANIRTMYAKMDAMEGEELTDLRERLKMALRSLIARIDMNVKGTSMNKTALVTITFRSGGRFSYVINRRHGRKTFQTAETEEQLGDAANGIELPLPYAI